MKIMAKFRKKPVIIEAYQTKETMQIETLEGVMTAEPGDFIITGVAGETYPCKDDIFRRTYTREFEPENPYNSEHPDLVDEYLDWYPELKPLVKAAQGQAGKHFTDMETELIVV